MASCGKNHGDSDGDGDGDGDGSQMNPHTHKLNAGLNKICLRIYLRVRHQAYLNLIKNQNRHMYTYPIMHTTM